MVRNTGDRRPDRVSIAVQYDERELTAIGATERRLDPRAAISRGRLGFRAARAGRRACCSRPEHTNRPGAEIAVRVDPAMAAGGGVSGWCNGLLGVGLALLVAAAVVGLAPRGGRFGAWARGLPLIGVPWWEALGTAGGLVNAALLLAATALGRRLAESDGMEARLSSGQR